MYSTIILSLIGILNSQFNLCHTIFIDNLRYYASIRVGIYGKVYEINKTKITKKDYILIYCYEISYNLQMLSEQNAIIYSNELRMGMNL